MKRNHHFPRRALSLLLAAVLCMGLIPSAFAAQENGYHDPAEHWLTTNNRTNELDAKRDYTAALGHSWQGVVVREATCEAGGHTSHICHGCGSGFITDYTDALGHSWDKGTAVTGSTCTGEGMTEYRCVRCGVHRLEGDAASGHIPGEAANCTELQLCTKCGAVIVKALGHDYWADVTVATCTAMGYSVFTCSCCGDGYKGDYIDATGHTPGE